MTTTIVPMKDGGVIQCFLKTVGNGKSKENKYKCTIETSEGMQYDSDTFWIETVSFRNSRDIFFPESPDTSFQITMGSGSKCVVTRKRDVSTSFECFKK